MKGARIDREGRRTLKKRPGPKQQSVADSVDRNALILLHALVRHNKLFELFPKIKDTSRGRASVALALLEGDPIEDRAGAYLPSEKLADAADALLKRYRKIVRDRSRKADLSYLDRYADSLFDSLRPKRASLPDHPVLATPDGIFGAGAWARKRTTKAAATQADSSEPAWVSAARLGAIAQADAATESDRLARRAVAELETTGFPIAKVLARLNLPQAYEQKEYFTS